LVDQKCKIGYNIHIKKQKEQNMRYADMPYKYKVITEVSSKEDAETDVFGRQILLITNNYQTARKECIE
jgi:Holliday junction resolvasome RuvABC DNA-binding subunit